MAVEPLPVALPQVAPRRHVWRVLLVILLCAAVLIGGSTMVLARLGRPLVGASLVLVPKADDAASPEQLDRRQRAAAAKLARLDPDGLYIVVDTYRNRLSVRKDSETLRSAICSTGTGIVLKDPRNGRTWVFDTPTGERTVHRKVRNPVWAKPDWAFIEEGFLPPKDPNERFDSNSLGDYALYMGDGYIIHGTLFKSLLGRRVTHGCIRLGDEDLEWVYRHAPIGTRVYLY